MALICDNLCHRAQSQEGGDIFSDAEEDAQMETGVAGLPAPHSSAWDSQPTQSSAGGDAVAGRLGSPRAGKDVHSSQTGAGGADRNDGMDEERRQRLRQVCIIRLPVLSPG